MVQQIVHKNYQSDPQNRQLIYIYIYIYIYICAMSNGGSSSLNTI